MNEGYTVNGVITTQNVLPTDQKTSGSSVAADGSVAAFGQVLEQNILAQDAAAQSQTQQNMLAQSQAQQATGQAASTSTSGMDSSAYLLYALMSGGLEGEMGTLLTALLMDKLLGSNSSSLTSGVSGYSALQKALMPQLSTLSTSSYGTDVLQLAYSRLGAPYSQAKAGQGDYVDCSYLTQWCYKQVGVNLPRTAAEQAKYCVDNGLTVSKEELQPGDLVFFSSRSNGRYMDITHVAVYAGDGMIVDASSSNGQVVNRELFSGQVLYARPAALLQ